MMSPEDQVAIARVRLWTSDLDRLLRRWKEQIGKRQLGHAKQARKFSQRHYIIGIPATLLGAVVTTGILSTFKNCDNCDDLKSAKCAADQWIRLAMGLLGFLFAALSALQTFMNYQESSEKHKNAASDFENLHRVIETLIQVPGAVRGDPVATLHNLRDQYTALVRGAPQLPKEYSVDLTYKFSGEGGPRPPQPTQIHIDSQKIDGSGILKKLLDEGGSKKKALKRRATYWRKSKPSSGSSTGTSRSDSEEEISIHIDLDTTQSYLNNQAALTAAKMAVQRQNQEQKSFSRALDFELKRLDTHVQSPSPLSGSDSQDSSESEAPKTEASDETESEAPKTEDSEPEPPEAKDS